MALHFRTLVPVVSLLVIGCGDSEPGMDGGGGGSGAAGGTGGMGGSGGTFGTLGAKPTCESQEMLGLGSPPEARYTTAGAMASDGRTMVVFGGDRSAPVCPGFPVADHLGDTHLLDVACGTWTAVASAGPQARARHKMVSDFANNRALLFGGRTRAGTSGPYTLFNDVWSFDFETQTWAELATTGTPPAARQGAGVALGGGELYVFGGNVATDGAGFTLLADLYALDLTTMEWRLAAASGPPARYLTEMVYSEDKNSLYVYGGSLSASFAGDTWQFDLGSQTWTELSASIDGVVDGRRFSHHMSARKGDADAGTGAQIYVFGGHDDGALGTRNDVLGLDLDAGAGAWSVVRTGDTLNNSAVAQCDFPPDFALADLESPERRFGSALATSPDGHGFAVFGGGADCGRLSDAWWFDTVTGAWEPIRESLPGLTCQHTGSTTCTNICP